MAGPAIHPDSVRPAESTPGRRSRPGPAPNSWRRRGLGRAAAQRLNGWHTATRWRAAEAAAQPKAGRLRRSASLGRLDLPLRRGLHLSLSLMNVPCTMGSAIVDSAPPPSSPPSSPAQEAFPALLLEPSGRDSDSDLEARTNQIDTWRASPIDSDRHRACRPAPRRPLSQLAPSARPANPGEGRAASRKTSQYDRNKAFFSTVIGQNRGPQQAATHDSAIDLSATQRLLVAALCRSKVGLCLGGIPGGCRCFRFEGAHKLRSILQTPL